MDQEKMNLTKNDLKQLILNSRQTKVSAEKTAEFIDTYVEQPANVPALQESIKALDEDRYV
jgi:hypothetical protein